MAAIDDAMINIGNMSNSINDVVAALQTQINVTEAGAVAALGREADADNAAHDKKKREDLEKTWFGRMKLRRADNAKAIADGTSRLSIFSKNVDGASTTLIKGTEGIRSSVGGMMTNMDGTSGSFGAMKSIVKEAGAAVGNLASAIPFVGTALKGLVVGIAGVSGFAMGQLEQRVKVMDETNKAGLLFADGLSGVSNAAGESGMLLKQFSVFVKASGKDLAFIGGSLAEGVKKFNKVALAKTPEGEAHRMALRNLGFAYEEQAELTVAYMAQQRRSGALEEMNNAQIRAGVKDYAKNLKILSSLTGEDVAAMQKTQQEEMNIASSRAALMEMEDQNIEGVTDNFKLLTVEAKALGPGMQEYLRALMAGKGAVKDGKSLLFEQQNKSATALMKSQYNVMKQGMSAAEFQTQFYVKAKENVKSVKAEQDAQRGVVLQTGYVQGEYHDMVKKNFIAISDSNKRYAKSNEERAKLAAEGTMEGKDPISDKVNQARNAMQHAGQSAQKLGDELLEVSTTVAKGVAVGLQKVAEAAAELPDLFNKLAKAMGKSQPQSVDEALNLDTGPKKEKSWWDISGDGIKRDNVKSAFKQNTSSDINESVSKLVEKVSDDGKIDSSERSDLKATLQALTDEINRLKLEGGKEDTKKVEEISKTNELLKELIKGTKNNGKISTEMRDQIQLNR